MSEKQDIASGSVKHSRKAMFEHLAWIIPLVVVAAVILPVFFWPAYRNLALEGWAVLRTGEEAQVHAWVQSFGWRGPLVILGGIIIQLLIPLIPSKIMMVVSVMAYGPVLGSLLAWAGLVGTAIVGYWAGRAFGPVTVERWLGEKQHRQVMEFLDRYGFWAVIISRAVPFLSNDAISLGAGLLDMGWRKYLIATMLGLLPTILLIAWLGADYERLRTGLILIGALLLAGFAAWVIRDWLRRSRNKPEN